MEYGETFRKKILDDLLFSLGDTVTLIEQGEKGG